MLRLERTDFHTKSLDGNAQIDIGALKRSYGVVSEARQAAFESCNQTKEESPLNNIGNLRKICRGNLDYFQNGGISKMAAFLSISQEFTENFEKLRIIVNLNYLRKIDTIFKKTIVYQAIDTFWRILEYTQ